MNKNLYIGILGGSFDPPHEGHVNISKAALTKMKLNEIWWIVTSNNPLKIKSSLFSKRYKQTKDYVSNKNIRIIKLDEKKSAFTIDTVLYLKKKYPKYNFIWLMGSDNLIDFHKWKSWKRIVKLSNLIVFSRSGYDRKGKKSIVAKYLKNKIIFIKNKPIKVSSTKLRDKIRKNY